MKVKLLIVFCCVLMTTILFAQDQKTEQQLSEMSLEDLLNMDVTTASKSAEKQSDAPGIISVLSKDELTRFGGTTLADVLNRVPGLIGSTVYMTDRSMISSRGDQTTNTSNHILFLINGRPVREVQEGGISSELVETFPINIIERIEVVKGPGSVLYGSNAFSAVINIITEKAEETGISVTGLVGNAGANGASGDVKLKTGDLEVVAAVNYLKKANWETNYQAAAGNGTMSVDKNIPNIGTGAFIGLNYKNLSFISTFNQWETSYFVADFMPIFEAYGNTKWKKYFSNLGYDISVSENWNMSFNVTYTQSKLNVSAWPGILRNSNEIVAEWTNFISLSDKSKLIIGGLVNQVNGHEDVLVGPGILINGTQAKRTGIGFYAQVDYQLLENLKGIGGLQVNKIQDVDLGLVPRIGFVWYPVPRINVKALYSTAFRAPSLNELTLQAPGLSGNPNLKPEKVGTFDLSVSYQGEQIQVGVNYFNSNLSNIVYQDRSVEGQIPFYNNIGQATIQGFEFEGKYYVNKNLYLSGSTLYQNTEDNNGNKDVTPISNFGAKAGVSYVWDEGITLSLFDIYQGEIAESLTGGLNTKAGSYNLLSLHTEVDLKKLFSMNLKQGFTLLLQVDNLLDKQVWLPAWGLANGQTIPYIQGRAIYFGLNVSF